MNFFNKPTIIICLLGLLSCKESMERVYYENGQLKFEVSLKNGLRDGKLIKYYEDGKVQGWSIWQNGQLNGESLFLFKNGKIEQKHDYIDGIRCCKSEFFSEDGTLLEVQYLNQNGQMVDYIKYEADGNQKTSVESKMALIIPERDTINYGDTLRAIIRLGNREFDRIEVFLGDPNDKFILTRPKLPKVDSITVQLKIGDYNGGTNTITGVVAEISSSERKELVMVPFEYSFYVEGLTTL